MKWLKRDLIIKISVIVAVLMTVLVSMNLVEVLDKYVDASLSMDGGSQYEHQMIKELYSTRDDIHVNGSVSNDVMAKEIDELKKEVTQFFKDLPEFKGNVSFPLVYYKLNGGIDVCTEILAAYNEELPYLIDYKNGEKKVFLSVILITVTGVTIH